MKNLSEFLNTAEIRGISYGALVWRKEQHTFLALGVVGSISLFTIFIAVIVMLSSSEEISSLGQTKILSKSQVSVLEIPRLKTKSFQLKESAAESSLNKRRSDESKDQPNFNRHTSANLSPQFHANDNQAHNQQSNATLFQPSNFSLVGETGVDSTTIQQGEEVYEFAEVSAEFVNQALPPYPELARRAGIEGKVVLKVLIDQTGKAVQAEILNPGSSTLFNEVALASVMNSTYTAAKQNGKNVRCWLTVPLVFKLKD